MSRVNFLICTVLILALTTANLFSGDNGRPVNPVTAEVRDAANADDISNTDLAIWYSIYHGAYLYGKHYKFEGCKNFKDLETKMLNCRDKLLPSKTKTFGVKVNAITAKHKDKVFDDNSQNEFMEDLMLISEGIKGAIE